MNLVITMAGNGQRFRDAGYNVPKYEIEVHGKTLFEWSMRSFERMNFSKYIFIVKKSDNAHDFIVKELNKIGIKNNISIIELDKPTLGQAQTAMMANCIWNKNADANYKLYNNFKRIINDRLVKVLDLFDKKIDQIERGTYD